MQIRQITSYNYSLYNQFYGMKKEIHFKHTTFKLQLIQIFIKKITKLGILLDAIQETSLSTILTNRMTV